MPKILEETEVKLDRADLEKRSPIVRPETQPVRSPGVHLSGVLKYIAQTSGITDYQNQVESEELPLLWALGLAVEEFLVSLYPDIYWQPGEVDNPVLMTCDGITSDQNIEEFKYTSKKRMSAEELIKKQWLWMQQGRGYCIGYGFDTVRWHVLWNNQPWAPVYVRYLIRFDDAELAASDKMIRENAPRALKAGFGE